MNILPANEGPILIRLENTCGETYSYELIGENAKYVRDEVHYRPEFDSMAVTADFGSFGIDYATENLTQSGSCAYSLTVFPTKEVAAKFITKRPLLYSIGVALIFLFTSTIFVIYDSLVRRRERTVVETAVAHGAIVSSLFPKSFRDKMVKGSEKPRRKKKEPSPTIREYVEESQSMCIDLPPPIAENFKNCTVIFIDIAVSEPC